MAIDRATSEEGRARGISIPSDEVLRTLLDDHGILRPNAFESPPRSACFTVFAQRTDARVDVSSWETHASRFFATRLGLTVAKRYDDDRGVPEVDAVRVVLARPDGVGSSRFCFGRPRESADLDAAERADIAAGSPGLGLLARKCPFVWLVGVESSRDEVALRLAAVLASVVLGPILSPDASELFGVRTARLKLEALGNSPP